MKRFLFAFAVALSLVMMACPKEEPLPQPQGSSTPPPADTGTFTPTQTDATVPAPPSGTVAQTAPAAGRVIASTDGEEAGLTLNVTELKRTSGGTVTLKFNIVSSGPKIDFGYTYGGDYNSIDGVHLIDPVGKKKYFVVKDADNKCVCSRDIKTVEGGGRINLWAKFPAPPPDVQRVTVVAPHFTPMDDVPIF